MIYTPRQYQSEAIEAIVDFFQSDETDNGFVALPTGSGKSLVIANSTAKLVGQTIVLQPSKEILEQNVAKFRANGGRAGIYSASAGSKYIDKVTFATIGSIAKKHHLFRNTNNILIDECHLVNSDDGMYRDLIHSLPNAKVCGLTATPYRLTSDFEGAQLKFINRTTPRIFEDCLYYVQNDVLFNAGHLAPLDYYNFDVVDRNMLKTNSTGTEFTDASIKSYYRQINMPSKIAGIANQILNRCNNLLVFCSLISEAIDVASKIPGAVILTGDTEKAEREQILYQFKNGFIECVINVGVLTTGFDYPELEAVLIARSTMSLALYYQIIGRVMRPFTYADGSKKRGLVADMGGNIKLFGKIETMQIKTDSYGLMSIWNNGRQLTDIPFSKNAA